MLSKYISFHEYHNLSFFHIAADQEDVMPLYCLLSGWVDEEQASSTRVEYSTGFRVCLCLPNLCNWGWECGTCPVCSSSDLN